jgi:hypothetical protein
MARRAREQVQHFHMAGQAGAVVQPQRELRAQLLGEGGEVGRDQRRRFTGHGVDAPTLHARNPKLVGCRGLPLPAGRTTVAPSLETLAAAGLARGMHLAGNNLGELPTRFEFTAAARRARRSTPSPSA